ncbi:hypothetical protein C8Q75DRAFT_791342 [Abortiporus biennis]|nr:hypothetical protein C8Q75DRAFT_791342 [Abortiporus biennis]
MTLPANDAFTLGLTGTHDSTRPSYSLSFRSTSPKIPFVSSSKSSPTQSHKSQRPIRRTSANLSSQHSERATSPPNGHSTRSPSLAIDKPHSKSSKPSPPSKAKLQPIDWEIPRKTLHSSIGFLTLYLYTSHGSPRLVVIVLSMALAIIVPADLLRLNHSGFERIYERCLGFLMRESEKKSTNGVIWYIVGVIFCLAFYPLDVAVVSILILSWADTAASTFGRMFGRFTPPLPARVPLLGLPLAPRKSLAGFIAGSLAGAAIAAGFWGWIEPLGNVTPVWRWDTGALTQAAADVATTSNWTAGWTGIGLISVFSGIVSGVAEALDLGNLDDNLTLPIISGGCIWGFMSLLTFFSS